MGIKPFLIFLDEWRAPPSTSWTIARSVDEAIALVETFGYPDEVSFAPNFCGPGAVAFAEWLVAHDRKTAAMPTYFRHRTHAIATPASRQAKSILEDHMRMKKLRRPAFAD